MLLIKVVHLPKKMLKLKKDDFWLTLKTQISRTKSTWRYVNQQNTAISLKPIHFLDEIKLSF